MPCRLGHFKRPISGKPEIGWGMTKERMPRSAEWQNRLRQRRDNRRDARNDRRRERERQNQRCARCSSAPEQDQRQAGGEREERDHPPPGGVIEPFSRGV